MVAEDVQILQETCAHGLRANARKCIFVLKRKFGNERDAENGELESIPTYGRRQYIETSIPA